LADPRLISAPYSANSMRGLNAIVAEGVNFAQGSAVNDVWIARIHAFFDVARIELRSIRWRRAEGCE
jgi:hypothetical protein